MAKKDLILKDLKGYVLSPGNIFWIKNSGAETLIAKKADYLNYPLIEKLANADHKLVIDDQIDLTVQHEFMGVVKAHQAELLYKEKLQWKKRIFELLQQNRVSQFELSQLAWMAWSKMDRESVKALIDFDIDLFKRSLNVASSYVFCALLLGYYQDEFLKELFSQTLKNLMTMEKIELMDRLKAEMDIIRGHDILTDDDKEFVRKLYPQTQSWAGERYNGSGVHSINKKEMNDLEVVMVALERHFSYTDPDGESFLVTVKNGKFHCDDKLLSVLKKGLMQETGAALSA